MISPASFRRVSATAAIRATDALKAVSNVPVRLLRENVSQVSDARPLSNSGGQRDAGFSGRPAELVITADSISRMSSPKSA
jgi:hypothetical protein